ncbi:precorrin-6y C5,15-methyltransferase (decarboxylating) subunit CbiE [Tuwongella immobilis]|uniref:Tetrapyrrole methylase domain-containing protein n=1 Tax=Tuwongella immobilis TaxID=692036 RepID=A0A6C2YLX1_9BACT|nr:precorrin-6y C5,15-methyltransferase (decarboxylating) subunit CbiE [Tuwongella immobilis]VIP02123.1 precorrin-6y -methyltransferase subunit : Precorrin-6Y C5,15-methyltransferase / precorrin-8W decarboxylase OS=uncultured planctomycete GN=HGMM_F33C03C30 PE=4 SV=1: TP_methylase: Methyltransf_18 [Tuwongella immobilis]VTS00455.1 precorrin-6y -methyltransferase subunit : Precorrin-6Y C5,15-methyltransferase / precorrin-8W decarboxylase OS=uncultured planctomycete GN=HGMM_F33C03C30 PE=4 SV=1: TP_m
MSSATANKVVIIGISNDGLAGLTSRSREVLLHAELVLGSENVLRLLPEINAERHRIGSDLQEIVDLIRSQLGRKAMVIVVSGDPLFYGIARYLCDKLGKEHFEVLPHVSSMQLAFARIKESWEEAYLTDLSTRTLDDVLDRIRIVETVGLFTSDTYHPARIARELLSRGLDYFRAYVCENLGGKDERITQGELSDIQSMQFDPLNVMILRRKPGRPDTVKATAKLRRFGNPDDAFAQSRPKTGLITQEEVRALVLARLDLQPGKVMWDVGAGSGSVALEAAQLVAPGTAYAIEQDAADYHLIVANAEMYGIKNVQAVHGMAPGVFQHLPAPDAIFIGGNGGEVARLLEASFQVLRPGGTLCVNVATLEMLMATYETLKRQGVPVDVKLINIARSVEQLESIRFEAVNPTYLLSVIKPIPNDRRMA